MLDKFALENKIHQSSSENYEITGIKPDEFACLYRFFDFQSPQSTFHRALYVFPDEPEAIKFHKAISRFVDASLYPGLDTDVYSTIIPNESNLIQRFNILNDLLDDKCKHIVCSFDAACLPVPPKSFFEKLKITKEDILPPLELSKKLVDLGYQKTFTVEEPGTFANRGEIFDIFPTNSPPVRFIYFDDLIEEIFYIDQVTLKTKRDTSLECIELGKSPTTLLEKKFIDVFKEKFPRPSLHDKERFDYRADIFKRLNKGQLFEDYPLFISLFFKEQLTLFDFISSSFRVVEFNSSDILYNLENYKQNLESDYLFYKNNLVDTIKPKPNELYLFDSYKKITSKLMVSNLDLHNDQNIEINRKLNISLQTVNFKRDPQNSRAHITFVTDFILDKINSKNKVFIIYTNNNVLNEIRHILTTTLGETKSNLIQYLKGYLEYSFTYSLENSHFITEGDFFTQKQKKTKKQVITNPDVFADQLSTLEIGDFVIHKEFGVGKYLGLETLELNDRVSDFITIQYQDDDKVYLPVYKIDLIQKHASSQANSTLANLKSKKFDLLKKKAKSSVKKLAFDLIELQAKRSLLESYAFSPSSEEFYDFGLSFKFSETPDQQKAIDDVISDMESNKPMDRLICGDVGFGKTEVAMRAAYKAVLDNKQVCILVPTTVLSLQHYNSFVERFKETPVIIDFLSRFKTAKQSSETIQKVENGDIDIIIGTHKLLSNKIKFKDLGLVIIDEEQRFGVAHKEKLKLLKETVDTLTLTATPIPRTLQLSFLGLKDLSIIKTAPPGRQSIKSYVVKEDFSTIKMAIEKELSRGGQIFIVHNKVQDIEIFTSKIRELCPSANIIYAHGQMSEKELEKRIADFYKHKYDVLISTTIIESGIDIPNANTMIIDRADTYGLSQLHQLRGRIGRSHRKAYAYFVIPKHKKLTDIATKRLKALQTYAEIGSGFHLASSDLEIRGAGDILGAEQSGHVANIGLELYMELLKEAIETLKGEKISTFKDIEIQSHFETYIPKEYVESAQLRLKYYKRLSSIRDESLFSSIINELEDQYGGLPNEIGNLVNVLKVRILLQELGINKIFVKTFSVMLQFDKEFIQNNEQIQSKLLGYFLSRPKIYKINPDFSINCKFKDKIEAMTLLDFAKHLVEQIKKD